MDTAKIEQQGIHPLDVELGRIDAIKTPSDVMDVAFAQGPLQVGPFFGFYVYQDEKKSDVQAAHLSQGGLGLPERVPGRRRPGRFTGHAPAPAARRYSQRRRLNIRYRANPDSSINPTA